MASEREALPDSLRIGGQELHGKDAFLEALETERDPFTARVLDFCARWCGPGETMLLHTSGSTGTPKPFLAGKREMAASAAMTVRRLGLRAGDRALLCLPLDYIAGQMVVVRAMLAGLELVPVTPSRHPFAGLSGSVDFAALVPLQVKASLEVPEEREALRAVRELIIGGAAVDPGLASELKGFPHEVWSTYGMTETLSHVALRPLSGLEAGSWYEPLDGVAVSSTERGTLAIEAPAIGVSRIETNDLVLFRPGSTRFRILGRVDNVIDSGGIKVPAEQVEEALRDSIPVPFAIAPVPDPDLGSAVAAVVEGEPGMPLPDFRAVMKEKGLSPYWKPRVAVFVRKLPETRTGKLDRKGIRLAAANAPSGLKRKL
ncbi:MAG: AMP-binding protein [Sutterellaceae bacterium]|nr:AMP-binding protein [Sutterellaceae bacterium]MDD7441589.1 AMP-binding protein [Sutterellaceae bacterium]MDY2868227.1 AMP-binding protein [Mesosutterella sp.]